MILLKYWNVILMLFSLFICHLSKYKNFTYKKKLTNALYIFDTIESLAKNQPSLYSQILQRNLYVQYMRHIFTKSYSRFATIFNMKIMFPTNVIAIYNFNWKKIIKIIKIMLQYKSLKRMNLVDSCSYTYSCY